MTRFSSQSQTNIVKSLMAVGAIGLAIVALPGAATALPFDSRLVSEQAASSSDIQQVRWRGGWAFGAGFLGGAVVGGALARPYYYGPGPYYYGPGPYYYGAPSYYGPGPYYAPGPAYGGDPVAYCMQRFRSYNPATGTYMGYDGQPHPCP